MRKAHFDEGTICVLCCQSSYDWLDATTEKSKVTCKKCLRILEVRGDKK